MSTRLTQNLSAGGPEPQLGLVQVKRHLILAAAILAVMVGCSSSTPSLSESRTTNRERQAPERMSIVNRADKNRSELEHAALQHWVLASLNPHQSIRLWDLRFTAGKRSALLLGVSSEFIYAAVLEGRVTAKSDVPILNNAASTREASTTAKSDSQPAGQTKQSLAAEAGQMFLTRHLGSSKLRVTPYSARALAESVKEADRPELVKLLGPVVEDQSFSLFWGLLRPTKLNVSTPVRPAVERVRGTYLTRSPVVRAKRRVEKPSELPNVVARMFIKSLANGRVNQTAMLLDPAPFESSAADGYLNPARQSFIETILNSEWVENIKPSSLAPTDRPLLFDFKSGESTMRLSLQPFGDMFYVSSVKPAKE